jgi:uncharacterized protein (TIGR03083 family)
MLAGADRRRARQTSAMNHLAQSHQYLRLQLTALLRERGPDDVADLPVAACPQWTVKNTVSHLAGVAADVLAGNLDGVATDPWTAAQVDARRDRSLADILDEWEANDPQVEALSDAFGDVQVQWLLDCTSHDADVRGAIGAPVELLGPESLAAVVRFAAGGYLRTGLERGGPVAIVQADGNPVFDTDGLGPATVEAPAFELLRGLTGRRSLDQIRSWSWSDDPTPYLDGFTWGPFRVSPSDIAV